MDPEVYREMLAHMAESQAAPKAGPQPRRIRIYLVDTRDEINGRPMEVNRTDAREWLAAGLAKRTPFNDAATNELVQPSEYRQPEDQSMVPLAFNPNTGRYEPAPATVAPAGADLGALVEKEVARRLKSASVEANKDSAGDSQSLEALRAEWQQKNPNKKAPPAAKEAWFLKNLA